MLFDHAVGRGFEAATVLACVLLQHSIPSHVDRIAGDRGLLRWKGHPASCRYLHLHWYRLRRCDQRRLYERRHRLNLQKQTDITFVERLKAANKAQALSNRAASNPSRSMHAHSRQLYEVGSVQPSRFSCCLAIHFPSAAWLQCAVQAGFGINNCEKESGQVSGRESADHAHGKH